MVVGPGRSRRLVGDLLGLGDVSHDVLAFFLGELRVGRTAGGWPTAGRMTWSITRWTVSSSGTRPSTNERWSRMPASAAR